MNIYQQTIAKVFAILFSIFTLPLFAQEAAVAPEKKMDSAGVTATDAAAKVQKVADVKTDPKKADSTSAPGAKKMVQDATINLQTTITGNQEQPRVLYILPWQSPQTANVDFEPLDNEQKAVFGHVEREELRRELESAGELK
jgi:uncharacterized protein YpuA (DUF1002 family)